MCRIIVCLTALLTVFSSFGQTAKIPKLKNGAWTGNLFLNSADKLPFKLLVEGKGSELTLSVINGEEVITLEKTVKQNDSLHFSFPSFHSKLVIRNHGRRKLKGYWINMNKGANYTIPAEITYGYRSRFPVGKMVPTFPYLDGKWETTFEPGKPGAYKGVGIFRQTENRVDGTFLTETGDFRFLEGNVTADSLFLSAFDGSHAFLLKSKISGDSMYGTFLSGKHWKGDWAARYNEQFELKHPDSLTYILDDKPITFSFKDLSGNTFTFPNSAYTGKVTIIQIMGTWCPNCMDETRYFREMYSKFNSRGLEIISIGYEVGNSYEEHAAKISKLRDRYALPFLFLVGGQANKGLASEHFSMLNQIISFPTAIFIDRHGKVRKIHTGFNGPGTGIYYEQYVQETEVFLQELLEEK